MAKTLANPAARALVYSIWNMLTLQAATQRMNKALQFEAVPLW